MKSITQDNRQMESLNQKMCLFFERYRLMSSLLSVIV